MKNDYIDNNIYMDDLKLFSTYIQCDMWDPVLNLLYNELIPINFINSMGRTFVHEAVIHNNHAVLLKLLDYGANLSIQDKNGMSPLHFAVLYASFDCIKILLLYNIDVNLIDCSGKKAHEYPCFGCINEDYDLVDNVCKSFFLLCIENKRMDIFSLYNIKIHGTKSLRD
jgi:ankyrin repeat protein